VVDADHRCNFSQIPHLLLDDVASGRLKPAAIVLYLHYKRVAFEQHGEPIDETLRETKVRTGLSNGTILSARDELESAAWLQVDKHGTSRGQMVTITVLERWPENCQRHGHIGQKLTKPGGAIGQKLTRFGQKPADVGRKLTKPHLSAELLNTGEYIEDPLRGENAPDPAPAPQRLQAAMALMPVKPADTQVSPGEEVFAGLYRGLGVDPSTLTAAQHQLERRIADAMAGRGTTGEEAEAYARETNLPGRYAPVNMQSFERGYASWLAKRRQLASAPLLQVANGRMPE
jgi:hypothetical protein